MEVECEGDYQFGTPASGPTLHRPEYSPGGFQAELRNSKGLYNSDELLIRARQLAMADNIRELEKVHLLCNFPLEVYIHKEFTLTRSLSHTVSHPLSHSHTLSLTHSLTHTHSLFVRLTVYLSLTPPHTLFSPSLILYVRLCVSLLFTLGRQLCLFCYSNRSDPNMQHLTL